MDDEISALAGELGEALKARGLTLAIAESCTGGGVAEAVTRIAGSSAWFDRGWVTYSNEAKVDLLGLATATLAVHGAVSEETAREMAAGAASRANTSVALAVTGIAGPDGGSPEKPVGLVWFAWVAPGHAPSAESRRFGGTRAAVRQQAVIHALRGLLELLRAPG